MGLIAIDPGVHSMAIAAFVNNELIDAWNEPSTAFAPGEFMGEYASLPMILEAWGSPSVRLSNRLQRIPADVDIIGERQVVYPGARGLKTNPNDLLDLAMCAGAFFGALCVEMRSTLRLVEPAEWKAQVPKDICRRRIEAMLTPAEKSAIKKGGEMHNVYDAIGIGLFGLGRAGKGMVNP